MFRTKVVQKKIHTFYSQNFYTEILAIFEAMWKNMVQPDGPQMTTEFCAGKDGVGMPNN
jgi:hypothetical protein